MKNTITVIIIVAVIGIFISAASAASEINVEPSYLRVSPGDEFTVNITVDPNGAEVYSAQYELSFDNSLLTALSQTNGSFLSQDGVTTTVITNTTNNTIGFIKYGETRIGEFAGGVTNPGVLATVTFQAIAGHEGVSELHFGTAKLSDNLTKPITTEVNNGNVEISSSYNFNGFPVTTRTNGTVHGGVFIDYEPWAGSETLNGAFDVPNGNIKWAYLYTGIWGGTERYEGWVNVTFSGDSTNNNLGPIWLRGQNDTNPNVWCSGHGKHWMYYNVTSLTNAGSTNIATVSKINATDPAGNFDGRVYGIVLVVVYEGGDNPKDLRYWINDGSDALNYVYDHDAGTTYFNGTVDTDKVSAANLTMVHLTAYEPEVDDGLKFNGNTQDTSMVVNDDFEMNTWDVTNHIAASGNDAWYTRCGVYPTCSDLDSDKYINICNAILVLDETPSQPPQPDLNVTAIELNPDYDVSHRELFANESNTINATITNIDTNNNSNAFNVSFEIAGVNTWEVRVNGLAAGASTDVSINWTPASGGTLLSPVNYNLGVTADCDGEVSETNENNNASTKTLTVYNNGYKGKRYTGGSDVETEQMDTINGNLVYSKGNSTYQSGGNFWDSYTVQWTSGDFSIPVTATVKKARLYVYYCWDSSDTGINASMNFNEQVFSMDDLDAHYKDVKGYASYHNHKSGTMTYNVTDYFNTGSNIATFTKVVSNKKIAIFGMVLVVVYEDANEPQRLIWINEECDILDALGEGSSTTGYIGVNETEATAYAPFSGTMDISKVAAAALITIAPAGDSGSGNEDRLYFNTGQWDNVWNGAQGKDVSIEETDVKGYLQSDNNVARIQSRGDYMTATNAFLVVEYTSGGIADHIVISEVQIKGDDNTTHDFVEIYNPTDTLVDLSNYKLMKMTSSGNSNTIKSPISNPTTLQPHGFYLWASCIDGSYPTAIGADVYTKKTIAANNAVAIVRISDGEVISGVGWGSINPATVTYCENAPYPTNPGNNESLQRKINATIEGDGYGPAWDTNDNSADFFKQTIPSPQNSASGPVAPIPELNTLILLMTGLVALMGYVIVKKERDK